MKKGFTLIELLVVIAIIGILSSVVLASLNSARNKGADAAVKSNLANIRPQAEIVYDGVSPNSYATVCADSTVTNMVAAAGNAGGATAVCYDSATEWAASSPLKTGGHWCVDFTGIAKAEASALGTDVTKCP
ncbi:MAG: type II secretion system protein [bacterium]|nr:type II secretion system protein [bacterium]